MFPSGYFAQRYYSGSYWPKTGASVAFSATLPELNFFSRIFPDTNRETSADFWRWLEEQFTTARDELEDRNKLIGVYTVSSGLGSTTDEETLGTLTVPKGIFKADPRQHVLRICAFGTCKQNTHNKVVKLYVGEQEIIASPGITDALTNAWKIVADIIATDDNSQIIHASVLARSANENALAETNFQMFTSDTDIMISAQTDIAETSDIVLKGITVELMRKVLQ